MTLIPTFFGDNTFGDFLFGGMLAGEGSMIPALPDYSWQVLVRNPDGSFEGELGTAPRDSDGNIVGEGITSGELHPKHCDLGSWTVDYAWNGDLTSPTGKLLTPGAGLVFVVNGEQIISGPWTKPVRTRDGDGRTVSIGGVDDMQVLADRLAHPQPTTAAPPYNVQAQDAQGPAAAETVIKYYVNANAGPGAIAARRTAALTIEADAAQGASVKDIAHWQSLLELIQRLALNGGVGFRVVPVSGARQFQVYVPADKTDLVVFGVELGNTSSYTYGVERPAANYDYALGSGTGTARVVEEGDDSASLAAFGRIEGVVDSSDTADLTILDQAIAADLAQRAAQYSVSIAAIDTGAHQWAPVATSANVETYDLGDLVSVVIEGVQIPETIREVAIAFNNEGTRIAPVIGTPNSGNPAEWLFRALIKLGKTQAAQIRALQRRGT